MEERRRYRARRLTALRDLEGQSGGSGGKVWLDFVGDALAEFVVCVEHQQQPHVAVAPHRSFATPDTT